MSIKYLRQQQSHVISKCVMNNLFWKREVIVVKYFLKDYCFIRFACFFEKWTQKKIIIFNYCRKNKIISIISRTKNKFNPTLIQQNNPWKVFLFNFNQMEIFFIPCWEKLVNQIDNYQICLCQRFQALNIIWNLR